LLLPSSEITDAITVDARVGPWAYREEPATTSAVFSPTATEPAEFAHIAYGILCRLKPPHVMMIIRCVPCWEGR
jgi:hypothetical protein